MSKEFMDNIQISPKFQERLADLIFESGYKKSDLARIINISQDILIRGVNIGLIPSTTSLIKIANYFNTSIDYLIGLKEKENFTIADNHITFQERLEELKRNNHKTEFEIAQEIGFQRSLFTKWKKKKYIPSLEIAVLLSQYFKVSLDYLLGRTDDPFKE